jgi:hypothetical protein
VERTKGFLEKKGKRFTRGSGYYFGPSSQFLMLFLLSSTPINPNGPFEEIKKKKK